MKRRIFVGGIFSSALLGCKMSNLVNIDSDLPVLRSCQRPIEGAVPFVGERHRVLESLTGSGLDGRYVMDIASLSESDLVVINDRFFVRTTAPVSVVGLSPWSVQLAGLVHAKKTGLDINTLLGAASDQGLVHIECSGNTNYGGFGLQSAASFRGVPFSWVLDHVKPDQTAAFVRVVGRDDHPPPRGKSKPGAAWVFSMNDLQNAFLATHMNGELLPLDHGGPVRLMVPGWYGCVCIKWVDQIEWLAEDAPATAHMQEFAARTMQNGVPALARDYIPAKIDTAATVIRVEKLRVDDVVRWRVVGLVWGGDVLVKGVRLFIDGQNYGLVTLCSDRPHSRTWGLWTTEVVPRAVGQAELSLQVDDPGIVTRRLDAGYYSRTVDFDEI